MNQSPKLQQPDFENFLLGASAAMISKTVRAPFDRIKLLLQCQNEVLKQGRLNQSYKGIVNCTSQIYRTEGVLSFFRGNLISCLSYFPRQAVYFMCMENVRNVFKINKTDSYGMIFSKNVASGGMTGLLGLTFLYPFDYVRTRLAVDVKNNKTGEYQFKGINDVTVKTFKQAGIGAFYRGFLISVFGVVVYRSCYFGLYDFLRPILLPKNTNFVMSFAFGYSIVLTSSFIAYPLDTVRRRQMVASIEADRYKGSYDCIKKIISNEGAGALFKGFGANLLAAVYATLVLVGYNTYLQPYFKVKMTNSSD